MRCRTFLKEFAAGQWLRMRIAGAQPDAVREGATVIVG
jgi:hypothetical protein